MDKKNILYFYKVTFSVFIGIFLLFSFTFAKAAEIVSADGKTVTINTGTSGNVKYTVGITSDGKQIFQLAESNDSAPKFYVANDKYSNDLSVSEYTPPSQNTSITPSSLTYTPTQVDGTYYINSQPASLILANGINSTSNTSFVLWDNVDGQIYTYNKDGSVTITDPQSYATANNLTYSKDSSSESIKDNSQNSIVRNLTDGSITSTKVQSGTVTGPVPNQTGDKTQTITATTVTSTNSSGQTTSSDTLTTDLKDPDQGQCWAGSGIGHINPKNCFYQALYYMIFWPISWLVGMAGYLLNYVFDVTVIHMADGTNGINNIGAIDVAWKTMRDLANIGFIFILLYLAISTIIGAGEHDVKKTLSKLVIVAILLNFSLFFTKIIIDSSNILAVSFYNAISKNAVSAVTGNQAQGGIGGAFMGAFRLQTLYPTTLISDTRTVSAGSGAAFAQSGAPISTLIGGSITMLVATIILLAALVMFIKRYVILILVMIFSPLAFAGMVLHQTEHSVQQWWNYLLKESFFAPVYMILLWISFSVITDSGFKTAIGYQDSQTLSKAFQSTENGQAQQGTKASPGFAGVLLDFMIVCALLIASLVAAEKMGVAGASGAMNFAKSAQGGIQGGITSGIMFTAGAAFNNTIGKMARTRIEKTHSSDLVARSAGQKIDEHGNISKAGFVSKWSARGELALGKRLAKGYEKKLEFESAYQSARDDEFHDDPKYQAAALIAATEAGENSTEQQAQDKLFHGYSTKQKANIMLNMQKQLTEENEKKGNGEHFSGNAAYQRYFSKHGHGRNTPEEYNEIMKITSQGTAFHNDQFREIIGKLGQKDEDDAKTIKKMTAEIENWKSSGQGISAIAGLGEELSSRFKDPAVANAFKNAIRNKFGDENFYSKMASDPGINEKVKNLSADAAYEIGSLGDYYKALTGGFKKITDKNGKSKLSTDDPKKDEELKKRFRDSIAKIDSDLLTKALGEYSKTGNIDVLIDAYRDNQLSADQAAANYVHQSNGTRSQRPSSEVAKEQEDIQKLVSKYNTSWK